MSESGMQMAELQRLHLPQVCTIAGRDVSLDSRALSPTSRIIIPHSIMTTPCDDSLYLANQKNLETGASGQRVDPNHNDSQARHMTEDETRLREHEHDSEENIVWIIALQHHTLISTCVLAGGSARQ